MIKILSWNIWCGKYLDYVIEFLQKADADIVGCQEVLEEHAQQIASKLKYEYKREHSFEMTVDQNDKSENVGKPTSIGNAIFTKHNFLNINSSTLSKGKYPRTALQAEIEIEGKTIHFISTHITHRHQKADDPEEPEVIEIRNLQAENLIKALPREKTIVVGDFNDVPETPAIIKIGSVLKNSDSQNLPTWSVYPEGCLFCNPQKIEFKLDYIFTTEDLKIKNFKVEPSKASDHLPITVSIIN